MSLAEDASSTDDLMLPGLTTLTAGAAEAVSALLDTARANVRDMVSEGGKLSTDALEREQRAAHGLAWLATYAEALKQMAAYAMRMEAEARFGEMEALITQIAFAEYLHQIAGVLAWQVLRTNRQTIGLGHGS